MAKYTTSTGWAIATRKLKRDDYMYLKTLDLAGDTARQAFIDECVELYWRAWDIDLIDYGATTLTDILTKGDKD